jgi:DNA/RNA-binding domain of Phe-tRNA-synthetase-like protein
MTARTDAALADARVDPRVRQAHPDYVALLMVADGLAGGPSDARSDAVLADAEAHAVAVLAGRAPEELPEIAVWRTAFASFGVKPRVARSSAEALLRRCTAGLPRIDLLTDLYNAVSVRHLLPLGGEDLDHYTGPPRLVVADGTEDFDTVADGEPVVDHPVPGEVVWRDDAGVTCRRWNWRQCARTRLSTSTTSALFVVDGLGDGATARVTAAADELAGLLAARLPDVTLERRLLAPPPGP